MQWLFHSYLGYIFLCVVLAVLVSESFFDLKMDVWFTKDDGYLEGSKEMQKKKKIGKKDQNKLIKWINKTTDYSILKLAIQQSTLTIQKIIALCGNCVFPGN